MGSTLRKRKLYDSFLTKVSILGEWTYHRSWFPLSARRDILPTLVWFPDLLPLEKCENCYWIYRNVRLLNIPTFFPGTNYQASNMSKANVVNIPKHLMKKHFLHLHCWAGYCLNITKNQEWTRIETALHWIHAKIPVWNVQTHLLLISNDAMFQIFLQKSIK